MKIGFIGGVGHHCLRQALRKGDVLAVASDGHAPEPARQRCEAFEGAVWYEDPATMLDTFRPDVVNVGAVYGYNGDLIALALERGLPVVSDKPVAASDAQLQRLRMLAKGPARLITEFPFRVHPEFSAAREAIASGRIGSPVLVSGQKSYRFNVRPDWYGSREAYGGTMLWVASHAIDFIEYVAGIRFRRVIGIQGNLSRPAYAEMEDHCVLAGEMDSGATALVHADYLRPKGAQTHGDDRLRVAGTAGVIEVREGMCQLADDAQSVTLDPVEGPLAGQRMLAAALGADTAVYSTEESLRTAGLLLACRTAADTRAWVDVPEC